MNNFIKLALVTKSGNTKPVFIHIAQVGHVCEDENCTNVGVTTHNNGGFKIKESVEQVMKLIASASKSK